MKILTMIVAVCFILCASSHAQQSVGKGSQTKKTDEEIYAEFQKMAKAELGRHGNFLLDKSGKPLPMRQVLLNSPPKKVRAVSIAPKVKTGMTKKEVIQLVGYPDDYVLVVKASPNPSIPDIVEVDDGSQDIVEENWYYGKETLIFDTKSDNIVRIEIK